MSENKQKWIFVGAMWKFKEGQDGFKIRTYEVDDDGNKIPGTEQQFLAFPNRNKSKDVQPDYNLAIPKDGFYKSDAPKEQNKEQDKEQKSSFKKNSEPVEEIDL